MRRQRIKKYHEVICAHAYEHEPFEFPLRVVDALYSRWGPGDQFRFRNKEILSINVVTLGSAVFEQDGRSGMVECGEVFLAHRGCSQIFSTGPAGFLHKRTVLVQGWLADLMVDKSGLRNVDVVRPGNPASVIGHVRTAYRLLRDKPSGFAAELSALAYRIFILLGQSVSPEHPVAVRQAMDYLRRHLAAPVGLADIADAAGMSVRHCNRIFVRHLGMSPVQFLISQRLSMARDMLLNTSLSIKHIAVATGYEDPLHFSQACKKRFGASPRILREQGSGG